MKRKKILVCFGTRPEAIKMCSLVNKLKEDGTFDVKVCVTAQHREMLDQVLDFFEVIPDYDLNIMQENQSLNKLSSRIFMKFDEILEKDKPNLVLVHGDTTTSSICAWASFNRGVKVGHIEAGLRTYNKLSPFPEELNRQITGKIADFHFAPTQKPFENLQREHIPKTNIFITGNTVIDSLFWTINKLDNGFTTQQINNLKNRINFSKKIILVTAHRRENLKKGIANICYSLVELSQKVPSIEIVFPVHLNPKIQKISRSILDGYSNIHLISPLDYPSFVWLMKKAYFIISDSGGIQEEAPALGKPVIVTRDRTEREEAIQAGTVTLVSDNIKLIVKKSLELLTNKNIYNAMSKANNPYGDGTANKKIIEHLKKIDI